MPDIKAYNGTGKYIFISYAHADKERVYPFIAALQKKYNVWLDEGIHYGQEWEEEISDKLKHCAAFIFMVSETSLKSVNCKDELYHARELEKNFLNILTDVAIKLPDWFRFRYGRYQMCNLFSFPSAESAIADLERKCGWFADLGKDSADSAETDLAGTSEETVPVALSFGANNENFEPLLKRMFIFLEDGYWETADEYAERVLDYDPENAEAYLGKLLAEFRVRRREDLAKCERPFDYSNNYKRAIRYGGEQMATILSGYINQINERRTEIYTQAVSLMNNAETIVEYENAAELFDTIRGFKDSDVLAEKARRECEKKWRGLSRGDTLTFGKYIQKENGSPEPIEWLVLERQGIHALLISNYALDCQQYNTTNSRETWETCSLRKWLNGTFFDAVFTSREQKRIIRSTVTADDNPSFETSPGFNTTDKVFLLSIPEMHKYFASDEQRSCTPTDYTKAKVAAIPDIFKAGRRSTCWWWLRSPGRRPNDAAFVLYDGSIIEEGRCVSNSSGAVRPAMWVNLLPQNPYK